MTDTWSVTWTVLPDGFSEAGRARLSLVPSLQVITTTGELGDSPVMAWPTLIAGLSGVQLSVSGSDRPIEATIVSEKPRQDLWNALFPVTTPVDTEEPDPEAPIFAPTATAMHYRAVADSVRQTYAAAGESGRIPAGHSALDTIRGLAHWSATPQGAKVSALRSAAQAQLDTLLEPIALTSDRIAQAATLLRNEGQAAAAAALPLALVQQRLRYSGGAAAKEPSHIAKVKEIDQADFHQVIGLLRDHPAVATLLGLRVDVETDAFSGPRLLRLRTTDQPPLQGPTKVNQPWSSVISEPRTRFVMAADPSGSGEIRNGMLDLGAAGRYVITTADLYAATQQFTALSGVLTGPDAPDDVVLPPQRNTGIVVAQVDRKVKMFDRSMRRANELGGKTQERVLFADDVTVGYRVDLAADAGAFRSVMRRQVLYAVHQPGTKAALTVPADDEGMLEGMALAEQYDDLGTPHLVLGEELFGWDGTSLVAPLPGRRVAGEPGRAPVEDAAQKIAPGYPLSMQVAATPGTLPRLRYGRVYHAQVRAVDLAGNSIEPGAGDPALVSAGVPYHRLDPVLTPTLVPRTAFTFGESRNRLVVRSDGEGAFGQPCRRHVFAPKATQRLAEMHGMFDAAFGPTATAAERERALAIAVCEQGRLTDPTVPDPADPTRRVPQPGIRVTTNVGAPPATSTLPLPPGALLAPGEYIALDSDVPLIPYPADPAAGGVAIAGAPGRTEPAIAAFGGARWPDVRPALLLARPGAAGATTVRPGAVEVTVPPATELTVRLSAALRSDRLDAFGVPSGKPRVAAANGQNPALSPAEDVVVVHAVSKPLAPLAIDSASTAARTKGSTTAQLAGALTCHPASTIRVDVEARWDEVVDDGKSPTIRTEKRSSTTSHVDIPAGTAKLPWTAKLTLGDTRRRDIECVPVGATRYREYFDPKELKTREGSGRKTIVPNSARPEQPRIHSVLPTFRWNRQELPDGSYLSERRTVGMRVYLRRPWMTTGVGEQLGVVVFTTPEAGQAAVGKRINDLVTHYAGDPLTDFAAFGLPALTASSIKNAASTLPKPPLIEPGVSQADADSVTIAGVEVRFDEGRRLWYADIDLAPATSFNPFVRLALVRYQPESVAGCHVSRIVLSELVQLPPDRSLLVLPTQDGVSLHLTVSGQRRRNCTYRAELIPRLSGGGLSVVQDVRDPIPASSRLNLTPSDPNDDSGALARGTFTFGGNPVDHDLVVREELVGDYLHAEQSASQTVWFELLEGPRLANMLG